MTKKEMAKLLRAAADELDPGSRIVISGASSLTEDQLKSAIVEAAVIAIDGCTNTLKRLEDVLAQ